MNSSLEWDWDGVPLAIFQTDLSGAVIDCNAAALSLLGAPQDEAPQDEAPQDEAPQDEAPQDGAPQDGAPQDEAPIWNRLLESSTDVAQLLTLLGGAEPSKGEIEFDGRGGRDGARRLRFLIGSRRDGRRLVVVICVEHVEHAEHAEHADRENRDALKSRCRQLEHQLSLLRLERELIAYELHDGAVQTMSAAAMHLQAMESLEGDAAKQSLEQASALLLRSVREARELMNGLEPPMLAAAGLVAAVQMLVEQSGGGDLTIDFHAEDIGPLAGAVELALYRIVQQALANVVQHSGAARARVRLSLVAEGEQVEVQVADDGRGFDPQQVDSGRLGLRGAQRRAELLGGSVEINTAPGQGVALTVRLPALRP